MAYTHRRLSPKRSSGSAELMYLLVVLAAGAATAWWAGHKLGMDLSSISTAAAVLGLTETTGITRPVGHAAAISNGSTTAPAAYCNAGETPTLAQSLAELKRRLGDTMGAPVECAHPAASPGDTIQQTSTGLAQYSQVTNTASFTDGWRHWAITPRGFVTWEGTQSEPPPD